MNPIKILRSAAFLISCFFVCSCENDIAKVKDLSSKKIGIEEAKNIESLLSQEGKMKAKLTAPYMLRYQLDTPKVEFPKTLKVILDRKSTRLNSSHGYISYAVF